MGVILYWLYTVVYLLRFYDLDKKYQGQCHKIDQESKFLVPLEARAAW